MKRLSALLCLLLLPTVILSAETYRYAIIPVEFSDVSFTDTRRYVEDKAATAKSYLDSQFSPSRTVEFVILPSVKLTHPCAWYGSNSSSAKDTGIEEAVREALLKCKADFSIYDNDNDGLIDNICFVFAGRSESADGDASRIWPQHLFLHELGGVMAISGKSADSVSICSEYSSAGVFCHEFLHAFGLMDMYDTDGKLSGGTSKGLWGRLTIMDNPGYLTNLCAIELEQLGLGTCLEEKEGEYTLRPISRSKEYLRLDSDNQNEYFLLECRDNEDWDAFLAGSGLVVYHVDRSLADSWYSDMYRRNLTALERWNLNQVNCRPEHQCARVVEAVPGTDDFTKVFFPQEGHTAFGSETNPSFRFWSGTTSSIALTGITLQADGSVSFDLITPVTVTYSDYFQDSAIIAWTFSERLPVKECLVSWYASGGSSPAKQESMTVIPGSSRVCSAIIEGLSPQTDYQASIRLICYDGSIYSKSLEFRTRMKVQGARPFIWLNALERTGDGKFISGSRTPLRIFNGEGMEAVTWYFNDLRIFPEEDGLWTIPSSGTLKAEVWLSDGSKEIIIKKIRVQ